MIEAIIFDMDGVIIDSEHQFKLQSKLFFEQYVPNWVESDYIKLVGLSGRGVYQFLKSNYDIKISQDEFDKINEGICSDVYNVHAQLNPNLLDLLKDFKHFNYLLGIGSSSDRLWVDTVVKRFKLNEYFESDFIVSKDDACGVGKPRPDIYNLVSEKMELNAHQCVAIEDSKNGVEAAISANMYCIGYQNNNWVIQDLSKADFVISDFSEINIAVLYNLG